jgi:hypothetical protein
VNKVKVEFVYHAIRTEEITSGAGLWRQTKKIKVPLFFPNAVIFEMSIRQIWQI